ncbi:MAG: nucleotidyltransferase family protein [Deltaproteobacteria bacterium]|nr:nucleotidyltransferase family protein [Deltaproteobacteria bacterium]
MSRVARRDPALPSPRESLLLRAAVLEGDAARAAWEAWSRDGRAWEALTEAERRVVPAAAQNLAAVGVALPEDAARLRAQRAAWVRTQQLVRCLERTVAALRTRALEDVLVLKGGALGASYHGGFGRRPMSDIDLWVPPWDRARARRALEDLGFRSVYGEERDAERLFGLVHSVGYVEGDGGPGEIDLHWHLLMQCQADELAHELLANAVPLELGGADVRTLDATDHLFHVTLHGWFSNVYQAAGHLYWALDAMAVLRGTGDAGIAWNRLVDRAGAHHLARGLGATLGYLRDELGAAVPEWVITQLGSSGRSLPERIEAQMARTPTLRGRRVLGFAAHWLRLRDKPPYQGAAGLVRYLEAQWDTGDAGSLPLRAVEKIVRNAVLLARGRE